jgi:hypothetical protein
VAVKNCGLTFVNLSIGPITQHNAIHRAIAIDLRKRLLWTRR